MDPDPQYRFCYTGSDLSAWQAELVEPPAQHGLPGDPLHPSPALPHARELGPQVPYPPPPLESKDLNNNFLTLLRRRQY